MAIRYKADILGRLKAAGYSSARLRKEKIFGEKTMQDFRAQETIPNKTLDRLCKLLNCQPGDIMEYVPGEQRGKPEA
ncbi:MAG: helix-turn-helix transcriptional regulator [Oscillibacter sp.]|nr:helix-turn-helix transcriptional regulator [Oscillibacter sp.]